MAKLRKKIRILVVEDESIVAMDIRKTLQNLGYDVPYVVSTAKAAIQKAKEDKPDLVLMDIVLKGKMDGIEAAEHIRSHFNIPVVYLTAYADEKTLKRAKAAGPFGYIVKPFENKDLRMVIEMALYKAKVENELRAGKASFHNIVEKSADGIVVVDRDGVVQFVNHAAEVLFGRKAKELVGELFGFPVMGGEVIELDVIRHGREPGIAEMRVVETEWNGQSAYLALLRDITERKQSEERKIQSAQQWRTTFDSITEMISIHDKNFKITKVNKALADAFKTEPKELIGKTCYEVFHGAKQPCQNCPHIHSLKTKEPATLELFEPRLGIHLGISTSPILDENGEVTSSVHIAKDITERRLAEKNLKKANEKLKEYNKLKDEFVSTASHELRTPLSIIMGAIRLVLDEIPGQIVEEQRDVLATAMESVKRLTRIVDSLLTISKIESGRLDIQKTVVNICELIKDTVSNCESLAQKKGICLDCKVPEQSVDVCLDPDKTKEVLINLISNSIKFTPEGGWIKVICTEEDGEVLVSVQDSGVGIAKKNIPKLFDKFTQFGRKKEGQGEKGTGLGLAIVKKLVEIHGGKIKVESEVGQGTIFTISLPLTTETLAEDLPAEADELVENIIANN
ncbi:MAG: ATP-binding protein [Phycisphaerae bacterium]